MILYYILFYYIILYHITINVCIIYILYIYICICRQRIYILYVYIYIYTLYTCVCGCVRSYMHRYICTLYIYIFIYVPYKYTSLDYVDPIYPTPSGISSISGFHPSAGRWPMPCWTETATRRWISTSGERCGPEAEWPIAGGYEWHVFAQSWALE